jgi:hypothetical protein
VIDLPPPVGAGLEHDDEDGNQDRKRYDRAHEVAEQEIVGH